MRSFTVLAAIALVAASAAAAPSVKRDSWSVKYDDEPVSIRASEVEATVKGLCDNVSGGDSGFRERIGDTNLWFTMSEGDSASYTAENCQAGVEAIFKAAYPTLAQDRSPLVVIDTEKNHYLWYPIEVSKGSSRYAIDPEQV